MDVHLLGMVVLELALVLLPGLKVGLLLVSAVLKLMLVLLHLSWPELRGLALQ